MWLSSVNNRSFEHEHNGHGVHRWEIKSLFLLKRQLLCSSVINFNLAAQNGPNSGNVIILLSFVYVRARVCVRFLKLLSLASGEFFGIRFTKKKVFTSLNAILWRIKGWTEHEGHSRHSLFTPLMVYYLVSCRLVSSHLISRSLQRCSSTWPWLSSSMNLTPWLVHAEVGIATRRWDFPTE